MRHCLLSVITPTVSVVNPYLLPIYIVRHLELLIISTGGEEKKKKMKKNTFIINMLL